jgi:Na+/citrate or Na+/malate symporter
MDFNQALNSVLSEKPFIALSLAAIGLATVFWLLWQALRPLIGYLGGNNVRMAVFWCSILIVGGGAGAGYFGGNYYQVESAALGGASIASITIGSVILLIYGIRKWVLWSYNQSDKE